MAPQDFKELDKIFTFLQNKHPKPQDYLATLPPELLIQILADVPLSSYLSLCHTSKALRSFIQHFARELCNAIILSRFRSTAVSLDSWYLEGWITPTIYFLHSWERRAEDNERQARWSGCRDFYYKIKITYPGPQFAAMLEEGTVAFEGSRGGLQAREDRLAAVLERWNAVWGLGVEGTIGGFVVDRRLAWFYGFPHRGVLRRSRTLLKWLRRAGLCLVVMKIRLQISLLRRIQHLGVELRMLKKYPKLNKLE